MVILILHPSPGVCAIRRRRSTEVKIIRWTVGGVTRKNRNNSASDGAYPCIRLPIHPSLPRNWAQSLYLLPSPRLNAQGRFLALSLIPLALSCAAAPKWQKFPNECQPVARNLLNSARSFQTHTATPLASQPDTRMCPGASVLNISAPPFVDVIETHPLRLRAPAPVDLDRTQMEVKRLRQTGVCPAKQIITRRKRQLQERRASRSSGGKKNQATAPGDRRNTGLRVEAGGERGGCPLEWAAPYGVGAKGKTFLRITHFLRSSQRRLLRIN